MATFFNSKLWLLGGTLTLSVGARASDESLRALSYVELVKNYRASDSKAFEDLFARLAAERADLKSGKAKADAEQVDVDRAKLMAQLRLNQEFEKDLLKNLGSDDKAPVRSELKEKILIALSLKLSDRAVTDNLPESEKEARSEVISLGDKSAYELTVRYWKNSQGKVQGKTSIGVKPGYFDDKSDFAGISEIKKHFSFKEMSDAGNDLSSKVLDSSSFELDPGVASVRNELEKKIVPQIQDAAQIYKGASARKMADLNARMQYRAAAKQDDLDSRKEKTSVAAGVAKLENMRKLAVAMNIAKGEIEPCLLIEKTIGKRDLSPAEKEECFPDDSARAEKGARKSGKKHAGFEDLLKGVEASPGDKDAEIAAAKPATTPAAATLPQAPNGLDLQLAQQREANVAACLGANQQLMASIPQRELDNKFNSLLQGFESVIQGSTLIPQVLVGIPPDLSGPGAYLQAQNAAEDLIKDWNIKDPEVQSKVKKELRAAELAASKAASDYEAYRFRLSRMGLLDPVMGLPLDSPEGVKLAKLERDLAAAGAVKDTLQLVQSTIRDLTQKGFNSINNGVGRTSQEVPKVGSPRVAPSRMN